MCPPAERAMRRSEQLTAQSLTMPGMTRSYLEQMKPAISLPDKAFEP